MILFLSQFQFYVASFLQPLFYTFLDDLMKHTDNPDYCCPDLPKQSAQGVLKHASRDIKSFFEGMQAYSIDSSRFTGKPELPHYKHKQGVCSFDVKKYIAEVLHQNTNPAG